MIGRAAVVAGAVLLLGLSACGEAGGSPSPTGSSAGTAGVNLGTAAVQISALDSLKFDPASQTAHVGDIVEWKNTATVTHTVTFDSDPSLSDAALAASGTWQVKFTAAGTYQYHCTIHSQMTGSVTVS